MFIGTCGFGSSGSSAVSDYLREFDENSVADKVEFTVSFCPDGLVDLEYHVMHPHSRTTDSVCAISRFRYMMQKRKGYLTRNTSITPKQIHDVTEAFLEAITQVKWRGVENSNNDTWKTLWGEHIMMARVIPRLEKLLKRPMDCYPIGDIGISIMPDNFYEEARKFIKCLLSHMNVDMDKNVVMDQPFSGNNPQACFPFFEDPYAIVVDRDPRDNYVFAKTKLRGRNRFMPTGSVEDFVRYYRLLRDNQPYKQPHDRVLFMQFEEMVYNYDEATSRIREFLKLPKNPRPRSVFVPEMSMANTQVFKRFPEFQKDVEYIEKELPEYLFDFEKYGVSNLTGEMFFGKSPLNR